MARSFVHRSPLELAPIYRRTESRVVSSTENISIPHNAKNKKAPRTGLEFGEAFWRDGPTQTPYERVGAVGPNALGGNSIAGIAGIVGRRKGKWREVNRYEVDYVRGRRLPVVLAHHDDVEGSRSIKSHRRWLERDIRPQLALRGPVHREPSKAGENGSTRSKKERADQQSQADPIYNSLELRRLCHAHLRAKISILTLAAFELVIGGWWLALGLRLRYADGTLLSGAALVVGYAM
jgi:hypothetical protein